MYAIRSYYGAKALIPAPPARQFSTICQVTSCGYAERPALAAPWSAAKTTRFGCVKRGDSDCWMRPTRKAIFSRTVITSYSIHYTKLYDLKTKTGGTERIADIRKEMVKSMEDGCGIYRVEETMQATCDKVGELRERFKNVKLDDNSSVWNTEWLNAIELDYQLDVAQAMAHSAVNRKESRGAHQRLDGPDGAYTKRDDVNFLRITSYNVCYTKLLR